jgi:hypothetical protein
MTAYDTADRIAPARPAAQTTSEPRAPRRRFVLADWSPRAILARGGSVGRDDERAYRDLQAAHDIRGRWGA